MFKAEVFISYKNDILEPQGKAVDNALKNLGFDTFSNTRVGKYITLDINESSKKDAEEKLKEICEKLLINFNLEKYHYAIHEERA